MNDCESIRKHLDAYRDGMLDETVQPQVEAHLQGCNACHFILEQDAAFEQALKDNVETQWKAPDDLWIRIKNSYDAVAEKRDHGTRKMAPQTWAMAAMLVLIVGLSGVLVSLDNNPGNTRPVATALVNEFHTFVISRRDLDYSNGQPEAVRQWFSNKVDFRVPTPIKSNQLQLSGGRLCNMLDQRVVSFMYQIDGSWISLYIMKQITTDAEQSVESEQLVQGYGYIKWHRNGLQYSLVGDIPIERLRQFADRLNAGQALVLSPDRYNYGQELI